MSVIKTNLFTLRPFKKGDESSLIKNINNENIYRPTLHIPYPYTVKDAKEWIEKNEKQKLPKSINFAIDINGDVIGGIGLAKIKNRKAEIGYWLGEKYWGRGIITGAVKEITQFGFEKLGLKKIYADVFFFNKVSMAVLKKNGYKFEGTETVLKKGKTINCYKFAKISL